MQTASTDICNFTVNGRHLCSAVSQATFSGIVTQWKGLGMTVISVHSGAEVHVVQGSATSFKLYVPHRLAQEHCVESILERV